MVLLRVLLHHMLQGGELQIEGIHMMLREHTYPQSVVDETVAVDNL